MFSDLFNGNINFRNSSNYIVSNNTSVVNETISNKKKILKLNGSVIVPVTRIDCVYNTNGETLDSIIENFVTKNYVDDKFVDVNAVTLNGYSLWVGTTEQLNQIENRDENTLYLKINDTNEDYAEVTEEDKENWNNKQDKEDENLNTNDKTIVGAINELDYDMFSVNSEIIELNISKADKSELPTKTSQLTNDSGFMTSIPDEYVTNSELEQTLIPYGQELDKKSNIINYSDHTLNGVETYNNLEKLSMSETSELEALYIIDKSINLTKGSICSIEVKFSDNTNLLLKGEVVSTVLTQKEVNYIQIMGQNSMGVILMDKAKYSIGDNDILIPEHNDNASSLVVVHPNANNVISLIITKPTTFEINNSFFMNYQFVNDTEKENWNNKADKSELFSGSYNDLTNKPEIPSIQGLASESYVSTLIQDYTDGKKQRYLTQEEYNELSEEEQNLDNIVYNITDIEDQYALKEEVTQELSTKADKSELFSGSYNDLTNKPEIPSVEGLASETYVNNKLANLQLLQITQEDYDALATRDPNTLYIIVE